MFYIFSKKSLILVLIICLIIALPIAMSITASNITPRPNYVVVIDPGHGGLDKGTIGKVTNVAESDLNLIVSKKLKVYFEQAGFEVVLTRNNKDGLYGKKSDGFKMRDMNARKKIIQKSKPTFMVSVHMNKYSTSSRRGFQVFYTDKGESKKLAKHIQKIGDKYLNVPTIKRTLPALHGDYFVLRASKCPAVIVECGFLSSPLDERLLIQDSYQEEVAYYIFTGVYSYMQMEI